MRKQHLQCGTDRVSCKAGDVHIFAFSVNAHNVWVFLRKQNENTKAACCNKNRRGRRSCRHSEARAKASVDMSVCIITETDKLSLKAVLSSQSYTECLLLLETEHLTNKC